MRPRLQEIYNKFQIIVVWYIDFVKMCELSKILNKDCDLNTKPSYRENFVHAQKIWDAYQRPCLNLDAAFQHTKEYKVSILDD
jgi:hypothetical protein